MRRVCAGMFAAAVLVSCRETPPPPPPQPETESATAPAHAEESEAPDPSGARSVAEETDDFLFEYAYPAEAGNIPALAALLDARLTRARASLAREAAEGRAAARDNGFPFNKYSTGITWAVVADTPRFLSLSAQINSYTGGAHGHSGFDSLVWDKEAGKALKPEEFFSSLEALDAAIGSRLCDMLQRERRARRGSEGAVEGQFDACVRLEDTTLLLGSSNRRAFNRIGVLMAPYVAGPYAEGSYEFTLPVDGKVIAAVKPEFRTAFASQA